MNFDMLMEKACKNQGKKNPNLIFRNNINLFKK